MTATPVAKWLMTRRSSVRSIAISLSTARCLPWQASYCKLRALTMLRNVVAGAVGVVVVSMLTACALLVPPKPPPNPALLATPTPSPTATAEPFAWARGSEYALIVRKEERTLTVYHRAEQKKVYPIVLGIASSGPKVYQGDLRTPEGVYRI